MQYLPCYKTRLDSGLGRTRTCGLLIRSLNHRVLPGSNLSGNSTYLSRKPGFVSSAFSVPFVSILSLLPHLEA